MPMSVVELAITTQDVITGLGTMTLMQESGRTVAILRTLTPEEKQTHCMLLSLSLCCHCCHSSASTRREGSDI